MPGCRFVSISGGAISYEEALTLQRLAHTARTQGAIDCNVVYLLEHQPVVTIGRAIRARDHLLTPEDELKLLGISVFESDRGGDITYHAPGQLVAYPIFDLKEYGRDLHLYLRTLEQVLIRVLAGFEIDAGVKAGLTGVWVGERKIAAIGIKVSRWVAIHGLALNIDIDLAPMRRHIVPCGIAGKDVTSLADLGVRTDRAEVEARLKREFCDLFGISVSNYLRSSLAVELDYLREALCLSEKDRCSEALEGISE